MMLTISHWLVLTASFNVLLLGCHLQSISVGHRHGFFIFLTVIVLIPLLCYGLNPWLVQQSLMKWHEALSTQLTFLAVVVFLEVLVRLSSRSPWLLAMPGVWLSLLYLQLQGYQVGWLPWSFSAQALLFAGMMVAVVLMLWSVCYAVLTPNTVYRFQRALLILQAGAVMLVTMKSPTSSTQSALLFDWRSLGISVSILAALTLAGIVTGFLLDRRSVFSNVFFPYAKR